MGLLASEQRSRSSGAGCLTENRLEQFMNSSLRPIVCREFEWTTSQKPARHRQTYPNDAQCGD